MVTFERQLEIRYKALEIQKKCKINPRKPIPLEYIIENCGYKIFHGCNDLAGLLGFTLYFEDTNEYLIITDRKRNSINERHRFTICHEIGHIVCGHLCCDTCNSFVVDNTEMEREAYIFADELLMPTIKILLLRLDTPKAIQNYYGVSKEAAENKLKYFKANAIYVEYLNSGLYELSYLNYSKL